MEQTQTQPVVTQQVHIQPSTLPASKPSTLPKMNSKQAILAAAKAQLAAEKATLKAKEQALKSEQQALSALPGSLTKSESAYEWKNAKGHNPYAVESIYPGPNEDWLENMQQGQAIQALAAWAYAGMSAQKNQVKAQRAIDQIEKAQKALAEVNKVEVEGFDQKGNELFQTNLDQSWCDLLNLIAEKLSASKGKNGKVKVNPAEFPTMTKKQAHTMGELVRNGFVAKVGESGYIHTDKGLSLFQTTWDEVKANLAVTL